MSGAWPWLASGALLIVIGLALWVTTFVFVPGGAVLFAVGVMKVVKSRTTGAPRPGSL
jgi:hypothetical protein